MRTKGILAAGLVVAGLEIYNRSVVLPYDALEPQLPAMPTMWQWRFGNVAVYEAGDLANPPLLMLHGHNAAASAAEMSQPFERLADRFFLEPLLVLKIEAHFTLVDVGLNGVLLYPR